MWIMTTDGSALNLSDFSGIGYREQDDYAGVSGYMVYAHKNLPGGTPDNVSRDIIHLDTREDAVAVIANIVRNVCFWTPED